MHRIHDNFPPDLEGTASRLERERPELSALELDAVKRRVLMRMSGGAASPQRKESFMKSRLAILSMLTAGLLMSGTGATLAVDGLSSTRDAATAQYGPAKKPQPEVLGEVERGGRQPGSAGSRGDAGAGANGQPTRQVELGSHARDRDQPRKEARSLPVTGYAGVTVLVLGLGLLGTGLVLRRSVRPQ